MIWVLLEIVFPLFMATLLGLFFGWVLWRRRKGGISSSEYHNEPVAQNSRENEPHIEAIHNGTNKRRDGREAQTGVMSARHEQQRDTLVFQLNSISQKHSNQKVKLRAVEKSASVLMAELKATHRVLAAQVEGQNGNRLRTAKETGALKANIQHLADEKLRLTTDLKKLNADYKKSIDKELTDKAALTSARAEYQTELTSAQARIAELQNQAEGALSLERKIERYKKQEAEWQKKYGESDEKLQAALRKANKHDSEKTQLASLQSQQQALTEAVSVAQSKLADSESRVAGLTRQLSDSTDLASETKDQLHKIQQQQTQLQKSNSELQQQLTVEKGREAESSRKIKTLTEQLNSRKSDNKIAAAEAGIQAAKQQTSTLEKELNRLKDKTRTVEQSNKDLQVELKATGRDKEALVQAKSQLATLQGQYRSVSRRAEMYDRTANELESLRAQLARSGAETESAKKELRQVNERYEAVTAKDASARLLITDLEGQIKAQKDNAVLLQQSKEKIERQTRELEATAQSKKKAQLAEQQVRNLKSLLASAERDAEQKQSIIKAQLADSEKKISQLQGQQARNHNQDNTDELTRANDEIAALEKQMEDLYIDSKAQPAKSAGNPKFSAVVTKAIQSASNESSALDDIDANADSGNPKQAASSGTASTRIKKSRKSKDKRSRADSGSWQQGTTKLGTAGAAHKDDLKVISGIGPVLEKTLNKFDIKSWEQLAALSPADVATVDKAISFPGRIEREQWVEQAADLVAEYPDITGRPTRKTYVRKQANN